MRGKLTGRVFLPGRCRRRRRGRQAATGCGSRGAVGHRGRISARQRCPAMALPPGFAPPCLPAKGRRTAAHLHGCTSSFTLFTLHLSGNQFVKPAAGQIATMAATNKCLALSNKSSTQREATNSGKRHPMLIRCAMKPTTKIRFTEPQIALLMRAYPNCNLDHLTELSFAFDHAGKIIDCIGTIKEGGNIDHDYAGRGLARLYERALRLITARQTAPTIVQFPNGERLGGRTATVIHGSALPAY
jgi:hypothetical protein